MELKRFCSGVIFWLRFKVVLTMNIIVNCELVLVQSCSFSIKMGGVEMGFDLSIAWFEIWIRGEYFMAKPPA